MNVVFHEEAAPTQVQTGVPLRHRAVAGEAEMLSLEAVARGGAPGEAW